MKTKLFVAMAMAAMLLTGPLADADILYYVDLNEGTSAVPGALSAYGQPYTEATDEAEFRAELANSPRMVIAAQQQSFWDSSTIDALDSYIAARGSVVGTTWLGADDSSSIAGLFEAGSVDTNVTPVYPDTSPFFDGLGSEIPLTNPGWGTWSRSWSPTGGAYGLGTLGSGSAGIVGNQGRTVLWGPLFDTFDNVPEGEQLLLNTLNSTHVIPEPATMTLLGIGLAGLGVRRYRNRNVSKS